MNSYAFVYRTVEIDLCGRQATDLDIQRAFKRYLSVTNQEEI